QFLSEQGYAGVIPLLQIVRERMQELTRQTVRWKNGREVIRITGRWPEDPAKLADLPDFLRPRELPRQCSVYLDAATLWPYRLEWCDAAKVEGRLRPLLQMESRDPVLKHPRPPDRCAQEFTLTPG